MLVEQKTFDAVFGMTISSSSGLMASMTSPSQEPGGTLKPVIAKTFPLGEIVDAHRYLESNQQLGKIVVTVNS